jgi:hypothetical protein
MMAPDIPDVFGKHLRQEFPTLDIGICDYEHRVIHDKIMADCRVVRQQANQG